MAYSPQNMYRPGVMPDTVGMSEGIAAAGKAVAGGIESYVNKRDQAKAAESEMDLFTQLYPDAAGMVDMDKFASANLAGKQNMLGMAKAYAGKLEEQKTVEMRLAERAADRERAQQIIPVSTKDGGTIYLTGNGSVAYTDKPEKAPGAITMQDLGGGYRVVAQDGNVARVIPPEASITAKDLSPRLVETPDGRYKFYTDPNGNRMRDLPTYENMRGPWSGGLERSVEVTPPPGKTGAPTVREDPATGEMLQWDAASNTWAPIRRAGGGAHPAAAQPAPSDGTAPQGLKGWFSKSFGG